MHNGNIPFGFEDPGLVVRHQGGKANATNDNDRRFREQFKNFPQTPEEAEAMKYKLSQENKALNHDSIL